MTEEPYQNREIREMFEDSIKATQQLRADLLNEQWGILPKVLDQTTKHNGRLTRVEKILLVVGTATAAQLASGGDLISVIKLFL